MAIGKNIMEKDIQDIDLRYAFALSMSGVSVSFQEEREKYKGGTN